jgi:hypothetical protein
LKQVHCQGPVRILLVDDQPACLASLGSVLTCNGYIVDTAVGRRYFKWSDWDAAGEARGAQCPFCGTELSYFIDPILGTAADIGDRAGA